MHGRVDVRSCMPRRHRYMTWSWLMPARCPFAALCTAMHMASFVVHDARIEVLTTMAVVSLAA
jgi:hypothetical protein